MVKKVAYFDCVLPHNGPGSKKGNQSKPQNKTFPTKINMEGVILEYSAKKAETWFRLMKAEVDSKVYKTCYKRPKMMVMMM